MIVSAAAMPKPDTQLLVRMREQADLSQEAQLPRGAERRTAVWNDLVTTAEKTQAPVRDLLASLTEKGDVTASRSIPLGNALAVTVKPGAQQSVIDALKGVNAVGSVLANKGQFGTDPTAGAADAAAGARTLAAPATPVAAPAPAPASGDKVSVAWGVDKLGVPELWKQGITGEGVTVGIVDSGIDTQHPALKAAYRGTQADGSQQHDYNFIDSAGFQSGDFDTTPSDDSSGHGTHVTGTIAGADGNTKLGVAPGVKYVGAKMVFEDSISSTISALDALQFMLAPTKVDGTAPDPSKGVDVINNSWGAGPWESHESQGAFDALKSAGILLVNAAGNEGRGGAGTVSAPGAYPGHISVAAHDPRAGNGIANFSSQGPSAFGGDVGEAPTIAAPGVRIPSAKPGGGTTTMDGTSMAAPHVTGVVSLMLQANPQASYDEIRSALTSTATDLAEPGVDSIAGHGLINAPAAVQQIQSAAT